jgi:hypothetical protein
MTLNEIMSAQALIPGVLILPVGGSANNSLCVVNCRHLRDTFLFRRVFCISSVLDVTTGLRVMAAQSVVVRVFCAQEENTLEEIIFYTFVNSLISNCYI